MTIIRTFSRACALVVLGIATTGCVVLPYGYGHGRYGRGDRHHLQDSDGRAGGTSVPRQEPIAGQR